MARAGNADNVGGRFDVLDSNATAEVSQDSSPKSSKRRRRKSAKGHKSDQETDLRGNSVLLSGSRSGSLSIGKLTLRTISELTDLRSNSADIASSVEVTTHLGPGLLSLARQSAEESQHTPRKPHSSMSFQDSRPATEGDCCLSSHLSSLSHVTEL